MEKMKYPRFYSLLRKTRDPKWFKVTTVHTVNLSRSLRKLFRKWESILWTGKWLWSKRIFYSEIWELEPILFTWLTWVIRKDLIEEFERELWRKIYKEIEFLPVEIVPEWWLYDWDYIKEGPVLKDYYLAHVLKRVEDPESIEDCEELSKYDFMWWENSSEPAFSDRVKKIIESKNMKVWKIVEEEWCQPIIRSIQDPKYRKKLEEEKRKEEEERRKKQEGKEKLEKALKDMWVKLWDIKIIGDDKE